MVFGALLCAPPLIKSLLLSSKLRMQLSGPESHRYCKTDPLRLTVGETEPRRKMEAIKKATSSMCVECYGPSRLKAAQRETSGKLVGLPKTHRHEKTFSHQKKRRSVASEDLGWAHNPPACRGSPQLRRPSGHLRLL